jgi:transcription elongation factor Elf1
MDTDRRSSAHIIEDARRIRRQAAETRERARSIVAQSHALRADFDGRFECPRCDGLTAVETDHNTDSSLVRFICLLCGHRWSVTPKKAR